MAGKWKKPRRTKTLTDMARSEQVLKTYEKTSLMGATAPDQGPTAALHHVWQQLDTSGNGLLDWDEFAGVSTALGVQWELKTAWEDALDIMETHEADRLLRERLAEEAERHTLRQKRLSRDFKGEEKERGENVRRCSTRRLPHTLALCE